MKVHLGSREKPGKIDAVKNLPDGRYFAFEWETGNISSSHRALNKMAIGLLDGVSGWVAFWFYHPEQCTFT